ncbi:tubulin-specific chaperone E-like isoform X2 [Ornithodoros turicata]
MEDPLKFPVGRRISSAGYYGTVRYYGPVVGTRGDWVGVEWEDPTRGKHNGCHNGVRYFQTTAETGGSFIRPEKVDRTLSILEAIDCKYLESCSARMEGDKDIALLESNITSKVVELVGYKKVVSLQSRRDTLKEVVLANMPVDNPGNPGELQKFAPNIQSLDLSHSLLSSWEQVALAAGQLHHLNTLILSRNNLKLPTNPADYKESFTSVKEIALRCTGYSWEEALLCALMWPYIERLILSFNNIETLQKPPMEMFQELQELLLDENPISSWAEVCNLGHLPRLKTLSLADCDLTHISFPDTEPTEKTPLFKSLVSLNLHNNRLEDWSSIAELNKLRSLQVLIVMGNSVIVRELRGVKRYLVISHLCTLQLLDRIEITKMERREAALYYINRFYPLFLESGGSPEGRSPSRDFVRQHPRFTQLLKVYGAPDVPDSKKSLATMKSKFINLEILAPQDPERVPVKKALPGSITIAKLRSLAIQLYSKNNVQSRDMRLTLIRPEHNIEEEFDRGYQKELSFYDVTDGCKILVHW